MPELLKIQVRRGTAQQWTSANPVLSAGVIGFESDTGKLRVGDGTTTWAALPDVTRKVTDTLQQVLDTFAGKTGATIADLVTYIAAVDDSLSTSNTNAVAASTSLAQFLTAVAGNPDAATIAAGGGVNGLAVAAWNTLVAQVAAGGGDAQAIQNLIDVALAKPFNGPLNVVASVTAGVQSDTAEVVAYHPDNKPVNLDLQAPGGQVTVNKQKVQTEADVIAKVNAILTTSPIITSPQITDPRIGGTVFTTGGVRVLSFEHASENTWLRISNGQTGPEIGVKPLTGSTIDGNIRLRPLGRGAVEIGTATSSATVRSVGDLTPDIDLVLEAQGNGQVKVKDSPVVTEKYLTDNVGPALQAAIASQVGHVEEQLDIDTRATADGFVTIATNNLTSAQHKVGLALVTQQGGEVTVNGHRVLTTEDALVAGGAGIDQAALEAAVQAATAPLLTRIAALEAQGAAVDQTVNQLATIQQELLQNDADIVEYIVQAVQEAKDFSQGIIDAINGPNATLQSTMEMFWLLNDIVMALIEATGIEIPGKVVNR